MPSTLVKLYECWLQLMSGRENHFMTTKISFITLTQDWVRNALLLFNIFFLVMSSLSYADGVHPYGIKLDGSIGEFGKMDLTGPTYDIKAEYGLQAGSNLFHSFEQFNVHSGEKAIFNGPDSVQNIIGRITGGASWLDGQIASNISGADIYLLNRSGIMVGPNASLDVSGSFHITTADYLRMGNDGQFFSSPQTGETIVTLASPPSAFGFLNDPAAIGFEGKMYNTTEWDKKSKGLKVPTGKTISVIGGDIQMKGNYVLGNPVKQLGNLNAPEGTIHIASVGSSGEVVPSASGLDVSSFSSLGNIKFLDQSLILTSGSGSGNIFIRGEQFYIDRSNIEADTSGSKNGGVIDIQVNTFVSSNGKIFSDTLGTGRGGDISISARESATIAQNSKIFADATGKTVNGDAGSLSIDTKKLTISSNSTISSETYGVGKGGSILIKATDETDIISNSKVFTRSINYNKLANPGDAGSLSIQTKDFLLSGASIISSDTYGTGIGGNVSITGLNGDYADSIEVNGSSIFAGAVGENGDPDHAGNVFLKSKTTSFINGGKIGSESFGKGKGGNVSIDVLDKLSFLGNDLEGNASRIYTTAKSKKADAGNAGNIHISAGTISFTDGGGVTASTLGPGQGGSIIIRTTGGIDIIGVNPHGENKDGLGSGIYARSEGLGSTAGKGGDISIQSGYINLSQGGVITSSSLGVGQGGNISVSSGSISIGGSDFPSKPPLKSQIDFQKSSTRFEIYPVSGIYSRSESTSTTGGDAGNIGISASDIRMTDNGRISTSTSGGGNAGSIHMVAGTIDAESNASISSSTNSSGYGGNAGIIDIQSDDALRMRTGSSITTSSQGTGQAGQIDIDTTILLLDEYASIASSSNSTATGGNAGTIRVIASETATLKNSSSINTSSEGTGNAGAIELYTHQLLLDKKSSISSASNSIVEGGNAGTIEITADQSVHILNQSFITTASEGSGSAGAIDINTPNLYLDGNSIISSSSNSPTYSSNAGTIFIGQDDRASDVIHISQNSSISTSSEGFGKGGDIVIQASDIFLGINSSLKATGVNGDAGAILINGFETSANLLQMGENSSISTSSQGVGNAGAIELDILRLDMATGAIISSASLFKGAGGNAGDILIAANQEPTRYILLSQACSITTSTEGTGNAGSVSIDVVDLDMQKGSTISSSSNSTGIGGNAGSISIRAKEFPSQTISLTENSSITTSSEGTGNAGTITIDVNQLKLDQDSIISSTSNGTGISGNAGSITIGAKDQSTQSIFLTQHSAISTSSQGTGNAGVILIDVDALQVSENSMISSASNGTGVSGNAGSISISSKDQPTQSILLAQHSAISTSAEGTGKAGDITLNTNFLELTNNSAVKSTGNVGNAGTITGKNLDQCSIQENSSITTSTKGPGNAGEILLETSSVLIEDRSSISSSSQSLEDGGNAGKITITGSGVPTTLISLNQSSNISTSSLGTGLGGDIILETESLNLDSESAVLASGNHGDAGKIMISAKQAPTTAITIQHNSSISTSSFGTGHAGSITLDVVQMNLTHGASVSSASNFSGNSGNAGMITIDALENPSNDISLVDNCSISTSSQGSGSGGNILIRTNGLALDNLSGIKASGTDGDAGSITITDMSQLSINDQSMITTSSNGIGNAGAILLETKNAMIDGSSSISSSSNFIGAGGDAGEIQISGKNQSAEMIRLSGASNISTSSEGSGKGGNIILDVISLLLDAQSSVVATGKDGDAGSIVATGLNTCSLIDGSQMSTSSRGSGNAGAVTIDTTQLYIDNSSVSSSSTAIENGGNGGVITIGSEMRPAQNIEIVNTGSISTSTKGNGDAGAIMVYSSKLQMDNNAEISSASNHTGSGGNAGSITAVGLIETSLTNGSSITTSAEGYGKGGNISIQTSVLNLDQSASIQSSGNMGDAGSITISDVSLLTLKNNSQISTSSKGEGNAGQITIATKRLNMESGAVISSASTSTGKGGDAGLIRIVTDEFLTLKDSKTAISTESNGQGKAGDIYVSTNRLMMENHSAISSSSTAKQNGGDAGTITIDTKDSIQLINSSITTEAISAGGGLIHLITDNLLSMENSKVSTSVWLGRGNGGDIEISTPEFIIMKQSDIIAKAYEGRGGNIHIVADQFIKTVGSIVSASSQLGIDGNVHIESPDANLSGSIIALPSNFLDASRWAMVPCAERTGESMSRLLFIEKDGVYFAVEDWIPSP